jgi:N-methylhydantoinase A
MRYGEQIFEIAVSIDGVDLEAADAMGQIVTRFHARHEALYAYSAPGQEVVVVNARVAVVGALPDCAPTAGRPHHRPPHRRACVPRPVGEVPVYRPRLPPARRGRPSSSPRPRPCWCARASA